MTVQYEASFLTCLDYFLEEAEKNNNINIKENSYSEKIINYFKKFYNFIKYEMDSEILYENCSNEILIESLSILNNKDKVNGRFDLRSETLTEEGIRYPALYLEDETKTSKSNLLYYREKIKVNDVIIKTNKNNMDENNIICNDIIIIKKKITIQGQQYFLKPRD